ncbi:MAG: N-acetylmuramoyl-L-alanine amidase [Thermoanaerobaculia bacterium]|nr:N-acetylmuramoyl-L-alanine amidase [Thermoanaerobaculia bacterium]
MSTKSERLKRRLVRELVVENLELIGAVPVRPRPRPRRFLPAFKVAALVFLPAAVFASSWVLRTPTTGAEEPSPRRVVAVLDPAPEEPVRSAVALEAPRPVPADVFPLAVRRVILDAGHGGHNLGTKTPSGLLEKEITLDIALRLREALSADPFEVLLTRDDDRFVNLHDRASWANDQRGDIFVSIHVNWLEGSRASGVETYYLGAAEDSFGSELASRENLDSGHTMAEMRTLLEGIYADLRQDKSRELAAAIHTALYGALRRVNPELIDRGVKTAPFLVLVDTEMPAVLAEVAALSSETEATMLARPLYRQFIAEALATGIRRYAARPGSEGPSAPFLRKESAR